MLNAYMGCVQGIRCDHTQLKYSAANQAKGLNGAPGVRCAIDDLTSQAGGLMCGFVGQARGWCPVIRLLGTATRKIALVTAHMSLASSAALLTALLRMSPLLLVSAHKSPSAPIPAAGVVCFVPAHNGHLHAAQHCQEALPHDKDLTMAFPAAVQCGLSTATATAPLTRSSPAWSGWQPMRSCRRWPRCRWAPTRSTPLWTPPCRT